ncbi:MAG: hypothetical protein HOO96_07205, partial [Polyangiaceae bacterium]|nr:hypothetical protein [Polyangiaceae bacterium]
VQGTDFAVDAVGGAGIDVYGGGGSGGACRDTAGSGAWSAAPAEGVRNDGGAGAMCAASGATGGRGGTGGRMSTTTKPGVAGAAGTGEAACGGGSGGSGRIVIETPTANCASYPMLRAAACLAKPIGN